MLRFVSGSAQLVTDRFISAPGKPLKRFAVFLSTITPELKLGENERSVCKGSFAKAPEV